MTETLAEMTLPRGAIMRIERVWLAKTAERPALRKEVTHAVQVARQG